MAIELPARLSNNQNLACLSWWITDTKCTNLPRKFRNPSPSMSQRLRVVRNGLQVHQSSGADPVFPPDLIPDYCLDEAIRDINAQRAISGQDAVE